MSKQTEKKDVILSAHTTFRLEALKYDSDMFHDDNPVTDRSGWRLIIGKNFSCGKITSSDISSFVDEVYDICKKSDERFDGFDKAHVCAMLLTKFRCTIDESMLGFILKSKTVVEIDKQNSSKNRGFFLFRFISWSFGCFKRIYNGFLDFMKIG